MDSLRLVNGYTFEIAELASLGNVNHIAESENAALEVCEQLTAENVKTLQFLHNGDVSGEYENVVKNFEPTRTSNEDGTVTVHMSFGIKSALELRIEALENTQAIQDLAIEDVGEAISDLMEG